MPPYGRCWDKEQEKIVIEESEAHWYREMFSWSISGDGDAKIAKTLNELGVPTRRQGKVTRSGKPLGKGWTTSYVHKILTDTAAFGKGKVQIKNVECIEPPLPPVVDFRIFKRAQNARKSRRHFSHKETNRQYLIQAGKGKCKECGLRFRMQSRSYKVKRKAANGETIAYDRKMLSPTIICRGMHNYPHIHKCRESKYIDFDIVQTAILRKIK
ncbi:recombinase family protein [Chloroflexota bacterium]